MLRFVVFVTFTPSVLSICGSLFRGQSVKSVLIWNRDKLIMMFLVWSHQKGSEKMEWSAIYGSCFTLCYILDTLFFLCYFGDVLTNSLIEVADYAYDSEWYNYPIKRRAYVAFLIQSAQRPFFISAYGILPCTIENLLKVCSKIWLGNDEKSFLKKIFFFFQVLNTTASAYMVMRKFYWLALNFTSTSWIISTQIILSLLWLFLHFSQFQSNKDYDSPLWIRFFFFLFGSCVVLIQSKEQRFSPYSPIE